MSDESSWSSCVPVRPMYVLTSASETIGIGLLEQVQEGGRGGVPTEIGDDVTATGVAERAPLAGFREQGERRLDEAAGIGDRPIHAVLAVVADYLAVGVM